MTTWMFFADAGLTVPLSRGDFVRGATPGPVDRVFYFGSVESGKKLQSSAAPGTDSLEISVVDLTAGSGVAASDVVLALSASALATNTPGAALSIGNTLMSGAAGAVAVYVRINSSLSAIDDYDDITLQVTD